MTIEQRVARLEGYFQDVITGNHPRWRAKHTNIDALSDITPDLGSITAGNALFGQDFNRHIGFGETSASFYARDMYNRYYFRVGYVDDYLRIGRPGRPSIEYDGEEVYTDGLTIREHSIPYTAMVVGPIAYNLLGHDETNFGSWFFSADEIVGYYDGKYNVILKTDEGSIQTHRVNAYDIDIRTKLHDGRLYIYNISTMRLIDNMSGIEYIDIDAEVDVGEIGRFRRILSYSDGNHWVYFRNLDSAPIGLILGNYLEDLAWLKDGQIHFTSTYGLAAFDGTLEETEGGDVTLTLAVTNRQTEADLGSLQVDGKTWTFSLPITIPPASADPADPDEGYAVLWVSDGTDSGDAGDVMMKITAGSTKTHTLVDFSAV